MTTIADPTYSRKAAAVMNSKLVLDLPPDLQWALRDALSEHDSEETLPPHLKRLFDESLHPKITEAGFEERLHPRGRTGQWVKKPFAHMGKTFHEHHHESGWKAVPVFEPDHTKWRPSWNTLSREEQRAKLQSLPLRRTPEGYRVVDPEDNKVTTMSNVTTAKAEIERRAAPTASPGELVRGKATRGKKGRKSPVKGKTKGWRERVEELRQVPILRQSELLAKRSAAMQGRATGWQSIPGTESYRKGRITLRHETREVDGSIQSGYEGIVDGESRGWYRYSAWDEGVTLDKFAEQHFGAGVLDDPEHKRVLDEWWGTPGVRGRYQTMGGDPGTEFQAQHERIMEAGAHIDAEVNRRLDAKGGIAKRVKTMEADLRLEEKWLKEAEKREEEATYEAIAKWLVQEEGWDAEYVTPESVKKRHLVVEREMAKREKDYRKGDSAVISANYPIYDAYKFNRFNIAEKVGVDLQALYDRSAAARQRVFRGRDDVRVARAVRQEHRRDVAYEVLGDVREFAKAGDLQFEVELDQVLKGNHEGLFTYDAKYMAGPKLERAALWLPRDWIRSSNEHRSVVVPGWKARGHYSHVLERNGDTQISGIVGSPSPEAPGVEQGVATMLHELVHRVEDVRDGVKGAEWAFYASRVSPSINQRWEETRKLSEITGHDGYNDHEIAREDHFVNPYSGKDYGNGYPEMTNYYEILTMGIQDLVGGEHGTIDQDEEYRHFVFGALALL